MGASSSNKVQSYLTNPEVNSVINNQELQVIFNKYKHKDGYITTDHFNIITHYLLNNDIIQRLFQITSSNKAKLNFEEFKYLVALFYTTNYTAKLNFLCDIIFTNNPKIEKREYVINVNNYYESSTLLLQIFLDTKLLKQYEMDSNKIEREIVYTFIDCNYSKELNEFIILKNINKKSVDNRKVCCCYMRHSSTKILCNDDNVMILNENNKNENSIKNNNNSNILNISNNAYTKIEKAFHNYEALHNGVFPIIVFDNILTEIHIIQSIINAIGNYLRRKTQKTFFNYNTFKDLLTCIHNTNNNNIYDCLFDIMSYPKDFITTSDMFLFLKETNSSLSSESINKYFNDMNVTSTLNKNEFIEGIKKFLQQSKDFISSFENIQYLHYMYFNIKPHNKNIENKCIKIFLGGKSFEEYIKECLPKENEFYIVDYLFWEKWNTYISNTETKNQNNKKGEMTNIKINTTRISNQHGGLLEGLKYMSDYVIFPSKMYSLFTLWYGTQIGPILKRQKIFIDNKSQSSNNKPKKDSDSSLSEDDNEQTYKMTTYKHNNDNNNIFNGIDIKTGNSFEIEIYPIFLLFFTIEELLNRYSNLDKIKEFLRHQSSPHTSNSNYYSFSRQTSIKSILQQLEDSLNKTFDPGTIRLWLYYEHEFKIISLKGTLENKGISNSAIFVVEIYENNKWPIDKLLKGDNMIELNTNSSTRQEKKYDPIYVGLVNIGCTCYMNSVLQMFLNNEDIIQIFLVDANKIKMQCEYYVNIERVEFLSNKMSKGALIKELLHLMIMKYKGDIQSLTPKKFKDICGKYNEDFNGSEQQDAHDFLEFLIDTLHEETNIKCQKTKYITTPINPNNNNTSNSNNNNPHLLADLHWSNNILNNASYIHSLYLGQLKSTLTCSQCHTSKISYETFTSLSLPIPEETKINIDIILFRLPFTLKPYYDTLIKSNSKKIFPKSIRSSLLKIKSNALNGIYSANDENEFESSYLYSVMNEDIESKKEKIHLNTKYFKEQQYNNKFCFCYDKNKNEMLYSNTLNVNIPLNMKLELNKKDKCEMIINRIKQFTELELEQENTYTTYLIINNGKYIDEQLTVDECFIAGQIACVYEMMNYKGMEKVFKYNTSKYKDQIDINVDKLIKSNVEYMVYNPLNGGNTKETKNLTEVSVENKDILNDKKNISKKDHYNNPLMISRPNSNSCEIILPIIHKYCNTKRNNANIFELNQFEYINAFQDYILLPNNSKCFRYIDLYNIIWEKYEYFLDMPSQVKYSLWWNNIHNRDNIHKQNTYTSLTPVNKINNNKTLSLLLSNPNNSNILISNINNNNEQQFPPDFKLCSPFLIKILNKKTKRCAFCPWFKFCTGCILGINTTSNIIFTYDMVLCIEWCKTIYNTYMNIENIQRVFNHQSFKENNGNSNSNSNTMNNNTITNTFGSNINNNNDIIATPRNLMECVNLFMQQEELTDIYCEKCKIRTTFNKNYEIARFPKYLIITLKRFKYTTYYKHKIHSLITFPLTNLDLNCHACEYLQYRPLYNLYALINHSGTLNGGHYYSIINHNNKWIKYDDAQVIEKTGSLDNQNVYILMYKMCTEPSSKLYFNYNGLMESAFLLYKDINYSEWDYMFNFEFNKDGKCEERNGICKYYYGEPVCVKGSGRGVLIDMINVNGNYYAKVKLNANEEGKEGGKDVVEIEMNKVVKETVKCDYNKEEMIMEKKKKNEGIENKHTSERTNCGECVIM